MNSFRSIDRAKKALVLATVGALTLAPLLSTPADAQTSRRGSSNGAYNAQRTLTGTVTRDLRGDLFEMRTDNGRTYRVRVGRYDEPRSLDRGDRVRITGRLQDDDLFVARNIEFLRDTGGNYPGGGNGNVQRTLTGIVTRDLSGDNFELRADNGRTYRVRVGRYDEPRSLDRGDRVRVSGQFQGNNLFVARNIEFLRDTGGNYPGGGNGNGQRSLTGIVTRDLRGDEFELRASNGRTYRVRVGRYDEPRSLDRGDRVRVTGQFRDNNVFVARDIEFLRDTRSRR